jgi:hypothetical protein
MKKLLALVLALVMTMGLTTVAANAAYPDEADVELKEAVEVMSKVGVFQGDENGNFKPQASLDRASAAKLIAYLDLGEKAAEALPAVKVFNDVPASSWAAKYIAYCADAGYIAGAGNNMFLPSNPLTGYAFGKMVLCVLGYDADIEGFTGSTWSINVAKLLKSKGIDDGVDAAASATLTREQAAQYCLNALQADVVEYDTKGTSIEINGAKIATGASKASPVEDKADKNCYDGKKDGIQQLCEKLYDNDLKLATATKSDDFGAPATKWTYKSSEIGTYADAPTATYNGKVTKGTIYTLLGKDIVNDIDDGNAKMDVYTDGVKAAAQKNEAVKSSSAAAFGTDKGMTTEVYVDEEGNGDYAQVTVVVKNAYVMKATADYNAKSEKLSVEDKSSKAKVNSLKAEDFAIENYKKDDFILYTYANGKVQTIEDADVVTGKVESWRSGKSVTIAGTKYDYSNMADEGDKTTQYTVGDTAIVVLDAQGNIIAVKEAKVSNDDVLFVIDLAKNGFDYQAKVLTVDGKKITVPVDADSTSDAAENVTVEDDEDSFKGKIMSYDIDDGVYTLTYYDQTAKTASSTELKLNKVTKLNGYTANSKTVYIVENDDGDVTVYTGVKNAPTKITFTSADSASFSYNDDDDIVYLFARTDGDIEDSGSETDQKIYVLKVNDEVITNSNKKKYVEVEALVDGNLQVLSVADGKTPFTVGTLYKNSKTDSNGFISSANKISSKYEQFSVKDLEDAFKCDEDVVTLGEISRTLKTDKVYLVLTSADGANDLMDDPDADYEVVETTFDGLESTVDGYKVTATGYCLLTDNASDSDSEVTAAYITITAATEA